MRKTLGTFCVVLVALPLLASDVGVRIRFGLTDKAPKKWDGTLSVTSGKIERLDGWRFEGPDQLEGTTGWKASTRSLMTVRRTNNPKESGKGEGRQCQHGR